MDSPNVMTKSCNFCTTERQAGGLFVTFALGYALHSLSLVVKDDLELHSIKHLIEGSIVMSSFLVKILLLNTL